jgi:hypothetical protein
MRRAGLGIVVWRFWGGRAVGRVMCSVGKGVCDIRI